MKKLRLVTAVICVAVLAGCGSKSGNTSNSAGKDSQPKETNEVISNQNDSSEDENSVVEYDTSKADDFESNEDLDTQRKAAEKKVLDTLGDGYEIDHSEENPHNEGDEIVYQVYVYENGDSQNITRYFATADFCMTQEEWDDYVSVEDDAQGIIMNFAGDYSNGRGIIHVEPTGNNSAYISVKWAGSAFDYAEWNMSGEMQEDGSNFTIAYTDCVKKVITYSENGEEESQTTEYENGSGKMIISKDGKITWIDNQEDIAAEQTFEFYNE